METYLNDTVIACATDEAYAEMAAVLLRSLEVNGEIGRTPVVLVGNGLNVETGARLRQSAGGLNFTLVDLAETSRSVDGLPAAFFSSTIYVRLLLPDMMPRARRILYLDCDIVVQHNLRPLLDLSFGNAGLAAVPDSGAANVHRMANLRLGRSPDCPYFNSGVLVFDAENWRKMRWGDKCLDFARNRTDYWPDQDAINVVLDGQIMPLERKWNFFAPVGAPADAFDAAHVIHFIPEKPTASNCTHPKLGLYRMLKAQTPFSDAQTALSVREQRIKRLSLLVKDRVAAHRKAD